MDGQYGHPMASLGAFYPSGYPPMMPPPPPDVFQPKLHQLHPLSMESLGVHADFDDPNRTMISPQQGSQRSRRRQQPGSDHVKHRRTRSGCYTCRQRRVKCDETRPICDRCRKGKRECTYPGATSSSKSARSNLKSKDSLSDSGSSLSGDEIDADDREGLPATFDDEEDLALNSSQPRPANTASRTFSDASAVSNSQSTSPTIETSGSFQRSSRPQPFRTGSKHSVKPCISQSNRWSSLSKDVKMYLRYHKESLSHHHYCFKYDAGDFLKTTFLEIAMNDGSGALLYAIVAFAAYHHTIARDDARISTFLSYYNKSIMLLQQSLKSKKPGVTTLLTILQLATIEEFLGDWVNLLGHQRAAHLIMTDLFTPQTIMQDETRRKIINWYIRFDIFAGIMSGGETNLDRDWFTAAQAFYSRQARDRPDDLGARFEDYFATSRLLATDFTLLFAAKAKSALSDQEFTTRSSILFAESAIFGQMLETAFADDQRYVKSFPRAPPPSEEDITNYRDPSFLYAGDLFTMNYVLLDYWAIDMLFKYQLALAQHQQPPAELVEIATKTCKMFEALEYCGEGPPGAVIGAQASLGIAGVFLPKDDRHTNWCRRKLALIEQKGYIYPTSLRTRMTEIWGVDVSHWWLPNDEGYPTVVRAIRDFIEYRARVPEDAMGAHVRDMSGIFRSLEIEEQSGVITDSEHYSPSVSSSMPWESSPEQPRPTD